MAVGSDALAEGHRIAQARLGAGAVRMLRVAFPLLDLERLDATTARWIRVVVPILRAQHQLSAQLAARYLRMARELDLGPSDYVPKVAVPSTEQITTSMIVTGPVEARRLTGLGLLIPQIRDAVFVSSSSAGMRLAMQGGRATIVGSIAADDRAIGWARTGSGHSCAFCSMLISRGPVYSDSTVHFDAHDKCSCGARAVYQAGEGWTDQSRQLRQLWDETTAGYSGQSAINAFRRAYETQAAPVAA